MTGGDNDYGDAFKEAKLEHDQWLQVLQSDERLQVDADADTAALSDVVLHGCCSEIGAALAAKKIFGSTAALAKCFGPPRSPFA